jgi:hypothetical protein
MTTQERIKYLEGLLPKDRDIEAKYWKTFEKDSRYLGHNAYSWAGLHSNSPRELFLMGILEIEGIEYEKS